MKTKVLLLSATPVNNQIADLRNQISLIAGGDVARSDHPAYDGAFREKLGVPSVKETTRQAQRKFTQWTKKPPDQRKTRDLIHQLGSDFFKLLDHARPIVPEYDAKLNRLRNATTGTTQEGRHRQCQGRHFKNPATLRELRKPKTRTPNSQLGPMKILEVAPPTYSRNS